MYLVEILVPLRDNAGRPFGRELLDQVQRELVAHFGGVTAFRRSPAEGLWQRARSTVSDEVVIIEIMTETVERSWWTSYRRTLEQRFRQEELVIRALSIERL